MLRGARARYACRQAVVFLSLYISVFFTASLSYPYNGLAHFSCSIHLFIHSVSLVSSLTFCRVYWSGWLRRQYSWVIYFCRQINDKLFSVFWIHFYWNPYLFIYRSCEKKSSKVITTRELEKIDSIGYTKSFSLKKVHREHHQAWLSQQRITRKVQKEVRERG